MMAAAGEGGGGSGGARELPVGARQQLEELKAMSDEIQTRAAAMKIELERKTAVVEELHSVRVRGEAEHVQKMKSAKQEWKKRFDVASRERDAAKHERLQESLRSDCELHEKDVARARAEIDRAAKSEREICERLGRDGSRDLEEARGSWQHAEGDERKRRDQQLSPKLKRDAAKAVEPKLRLLMEQNKEEVARLERERAQELDRYRLELYKQSNVEFKREARAVRDREWKRNEQLEAEWLVKLESSGLRHEAETKKLHQEHAQRAAMMNRQFQADKQTCIEEHARIKKEARVDESRQMEDIRVRYAREMADMEDEYSEKNTQRQHSCSNGFKQWTNTREAKLREEEGRKLRDEKIKMKAKIQSDIDLVKRKLKEEKMEQQQQTKTNIARSKAAIKEKHDVEVNRLKCMLREAVQESSVLEKEEAEESRIARELQGDVSRLEELLHKQEKHLRGTEGRLDTIANECDQQGANTKKDGERRMIQVQHEQDALETELDNLIEDHPKQRNEWKHRLEGLQSENEREVSLATTKVDATIKAKRTLLERESNSLCQLQEETRHMKAQLDEARIRKVVGEDPKSRSTK